MTSKVELARIDSPTISNQSTQMEVSGRLGDMRVRLVHNDAELRAIQALRHQVFAEEFGHGNQFSKTPGSLDQDEYDEICDHLIVTVNQPGLQLEDDNTVSNVVGTYRLLKQETAQQHSGFYSENEFELKSLLDRHKSLRFLELGRSCVLKPYRNRRTIELLWHGTWAYVLQGKVDVMVGCASFNGTDPDQLAEPLTFLHHHFRATERWQVDAHGNRAEKLNRMDIDQVDNKRAMKALPPLIKGYLRLGAMIGNHGVVEPVFGTTDILIILPVSRLNPRYVNYYGADAGRHLDRG